MEINYIMKKWSQQMLFNVGVAFCLDILFTHCLFCFLFAELEIDMKIFKSMVYQKFRAILHNRCFDILDRPIPHFVENRARASAMLAQQPALQPQAKDSICAKVRAAKQTQSSCNK